MRYSDSSNMNKQDDSSAVQMLARQALLSEFLFSEACSSPLEETLAAGCTLYLSHRYFCVLCCRMDEMSHVGLKQLCSLENAMQKLLGADYTAYFCWKGKKLLYIVLNARDTHGIHGHILQIRQLLSVMLASSFASYIGVGSIVDEPSKLHLSAEQARNTMHYAALSGLREPQFFPAGEAISDKTDFDLHAEKHRIGCAIEENDPVQAHQLLKKLLYAIPADADQKTLRQLYAELYVELLLHGKDQKVAVTAAQNLALIFSVSNIYEVKNRLVALINLLCDSRVSFSSKPKDAMIISYIEENVFCPELSLAAISSKFHCSASYISSLFKREKGINYIDYVNQKRIARAEKLIHTSAALPEDVYSLVGYVSQSTYYRNFSKYTSRTPCMCEKKN